MSAERAREVVRRRLDARRVATRSALRRYLRGLARLRDAHDWATREVQEPLSREEMDRRRARRAERKSTNKTGES